MQERDNPSSGEAISRLIQSAAIGAAALALLLLVLGNMPGMTILYLLLAPFGAKLVLSQWWTFSIILSAAIYGGIYLWRRDLDAVNPIYGLLAAISAAFFLIAHFGFLASFPSDFVSRYLG